MIEFYYRNLACLQVKDKRQPVMSVTAAVALETEPQGGGDTGGDLADSWHLSAPCGADIAQAALNLLQRIGGSEAFGVHWTETVRAALTNRILTLVLDKSETRSVGSCLGQRSFWLSLAALIVLKVGLINHLLF